MRMRFAGDMIFDPSFNGGARQEPVQKSEYLHSILFRQWNTILKHAERLGKLPVLDTHTKTQMPTPTCYRVQPEAVIGGFVKQVLQAGPGSLSMCCQSCLWTELFCQPGLKCLVAHVNLESLVRSRSCSKSGN